MEKRVTPERAIAFTKLSVALACSWPPSPLATRRQLLFFNALWCAGFISSVALLLPLLCAIYEYRKDPIILGKTVSLASAVSQVAIKMIMCRLQQRQFQILYSDMEQYCRNAKEKEREVLQRYAEKYKYIHGLYILWCFMTTVFVIAGPLYSPQSFPTHAVYPFPVKSQPLKSVIFLHQSLVGFQASSGMAVDIQTALLLRYAAARFELLCEQMRNAKSNRDFDSCIEEHCKLLRYIKDIKKSSRFFILATITTTTLAMIFGSLNLITEQPLLLKGLYAIVVFSASVELFMYAWPADNLMRMCMEPALAVYETNWYESDVKIQRKVLYIIKRSQKLETIRIDGFVPTLSLPYYAKYLYTSISYFTALRMMIGS